MRMTLPVHEQVGGLEIPMHEVVLVGEADRFDDFHHQRDDLLGQLDCSSRAQWARS